MNDAAEWGGAPPVNASLLLAALPIRTWVCDGDGRWFYVSPQWREFTGRSGAELLGQGWQERLHPEERVAVVAAWTRAVHAREPFRLRCRLRRHDGVFRSLRLSGNHLPGSTGGWLGTAVDVDEEARDSDLQRLNEDLQQRNALLLAEIAQHHLEEEALRQANQQLAEADQRKNDFLAALSHELRSPLAPIRNSLYIMERAEPGGSQARHASQVISRQAEFMTRLIDDLLDVSRITRGKVHLQRETVHLCELVRRTAEDHRPTFEANGLALAVDARQDVVIDGDPTRLSQVVSNLLQNAAKFTPRGGRVVVAVGAEERQAVVRVRDNGAGLSRESLSRLFEPFTQDARTRERSTAGLGLGLALVKGLVELHGGSVQASSEGPGKGAEFTIRLPLRAQPESAAERAAQPAIRVLVIEDNRDAAESLKEALELGPHEVEIAGDGPSGLEKAHQFHPQVVLCDIGLPLMDGYEVARRMRGDPELRRLYLVALSGYAAQEDAERARAVGFDRHMAKPPNMEVLEKLLAQVPASS